MGAGVVRYHTPAAMVVVVVVLRLSGVTMSETMAKKIVAKLAGREITYAPRRGHQQEATRITMHHDHDLPPTQPTSPSNTLIDSW